ncbi:nucleotidyltransferase domain-containing protein [Alcanivorax marinus]|nr:nucleotidyltransferase domain-containing protein [Alloalcanivorax marinus]
MQRCPTKRSRHGSAVEAALGDSIIGIYLFGSAVVGGLRRDSDVDVLVAMIEPPTFEQRRALISR